MPETLESLVHDLAAGGDAAKRALNKLKRKPPRGAAAALVAELTEARVALIARPPGKHTDKNDPSRAVRVHVQAILEALVPHRDEVAVVRRVLEIHERATDWQTHENARALLHASSRVEAKDGLLAGLLGPIGSRMDSASKRFEELPVDEALAWLDRLAKPARLKTADGERALWHVVATDARGHLDDIAELRRHPRYLDVCARLLGGPLHESAVNALAQVGDRRALPGLLERLADASVSTRMYAVESLAVVRDASAVPAIETYLQRKGLHKLELAQAKKTLAALGAGGKPRKAAPKDPPKPRKAAKLDVSIEPAKDPSPAQLSRDDGSYTLTFDDFAGTAKTFAKAKNDGGGYGWAGVIDWLLRTYSAKTHAEVELDPEASMFVATSDKRRALLVVAALLQQAVRDPKLLREAIRNADPELMD